jgi:hypothetical protein
LIISKEQAKQGVDIILELVRSHQWWQGSGRKNEDKIDPEQIIGSEKIGGINRDPMNDECSYYDLWG